MTDDIDNDATTLHESGGVVQPTDAQIDAQVRDVYTAQGPRGLMQLCRQLLTERAVPQAPLQAEPVPVVASEPLTDRQIEKLREETFSTTNPFCPVDSKSMRKAVRAAERAHGIKGECK